MIILAICLMLLLPIVAGAILTQILRDYDERDGTEQLDEDVDESLDIDDNDQDVGIVEELHEVKELHEHEKSAKK